MSTDSTGGTGAERAARRAQAASITHDVIDAAAVAAVEESVGAAEYGAVVTFRGVVRDNDSDRSVTGLDYEAHPQAQEFLERCCAEVARESGLRVAAVHRVGELTIGDVALVAAVASGHRAEAFAACAALVDRIKSEVPIWKRQHFTDGVSEWVGL